MSREKIDLKLQREELLNEAETAWLEECLNAEKARMSALLNNLPEAAPSRAWRSKLSDRLLAEARKRRGLLARWGIRPVVASLATAAAAVAIIVANLDRPGSAEGPALTAEKMLQWHDEAMASSLLPSDSANLEGLSTLPVQQPADESDDLLYKGSLHNL